MAGMAMTTSVLASGGVRRHSDGRKSRLCSTATLPTQRLQSCLRKTGTTLRRRRCAALQPPQAVALGGVMEKLAAANAEMLARKEGKELVGRKTGGVKPMRSFPAEVVNGKPEIASKVLEQLGCACVTGALSSESADKLLAYVNAESERAKAAVTEGVVGFDERFGGVNCRGMNGLFGNRQDMFLPMSEPLVRDSMEEIAANLAPFLKEAIGSEGMIHELSCLVADPGSPRQCIHADTIHMPCPQYPNVSVEPLYTFFFALQDVEDGMGHTVFLPQTHTAQAHLLWNSSQRQKERFIQSQPAVVSGLKKGDVAIFDSRILHCGMENCSSKRRVLFYFTASRMQRWPLPNGHHGSNSRRAEDAWRWQLKDLLTEPTIPRGALPKRSSPKSGRIDFSAIVGAAYAKELQRHREGGLCFKFHKKGHRVF